MEPGLNHFKALPLNLLYYQSSSAIWLIHTFFFSFASLWEFQHGVGMSHVQSELLSGHLSLPCLLAVVSVV